MAGLVLPLLLLFSVSITQAADWRSQTATGGTVTIDPNTIRAVITRDGVETQLWDGTHRMQDGSTLIIRDGVAVPNREVLESRRLRPPEEPAEWEDMLIVGYSPCEKLVRQVCGRQDECSGVEGCGLSRQLLTMEQEERDASNNRNLMTYTSGQCMYVLTDSEFFPACKAAATAK